MIPVGFMRSRGIAAVEGVSPDFVPADATNFTLASVPAVETGGGDIMFGGFLFFDTIMTSQIIVQKWGVTVGTQDYRFLNLGGVLVFQVGDGATSAVVIVGPTPLKRWFSFICWHDATANTVNLSVDGAEAFNPFTGPINDSSQELEISSSDAGISMDGSMSGLFFANAVLDEETRAAMAFPGVVKMFSNLPPLIREQLSAFWPMTENSDGSGQIDRRDLIEGALLVDNNTIASRAGPPTVVCPELIIDEIAHWYLTGWKQYVDAGVTLAVGDLDVIQEWHDIVGGLNLTSAGAARPVLRRTEDERRVEFDGVDDRMTAGVVADWIKLHDGSDFSVLSNVEILGADPEAIYPIIDTTANGANTDVGLTVTYDDLAGNENLFASKIVNGAATAIEATSVADSIPLASNTALSVNHEAGKTGDDFEQEVNRVPRDGGEPLAAFSVANPTNVLTVGANGSLADAFSNIRMGDLIICDDFLTTPQNANTQLYLQKKTTLASQEPPFPSFITGLQFYVHSGFRITRNSSDLLSQWRDLSGFSRHINQATTNLKPLLVSGVFGDLPGVEWDGGDDVMNLATALTLGDNTVFMVIKPKITYNTASAGAKIFGRGDGETLPTGLIALGPSTGNIANEYFSYLGRPAAGNTFGVAATSGSFAADTPFILTCKLGGTTETLRIDGVDQGLTVSSAGGLDSSLMGFKNIQSIGNDINSAPLDGSIAALMVYDTALSVGNTDIVEAFLDAQFGPIL